MFRDRFTWLHTFITKNDFIRNIFKGTWIYLRTVQNSKRVWKFLMGRWQYEQNNTNLKLTSLNFP